MKSILLALALVSCAPPPRIPQHPSVETHTSPPRTAAQQDASAVRIETACVTGDAFSGQASLEVGGGVGSGVIASTATVLTAAHVVACRGARIIHVVTAAGTKYPAEVAYVDYSRDYARLAVRGLPAIGSVVLAPARVGEPVCVVAAHPIVGRFCGSVSKIEWKRLPNGTMDLWTTARIVQGNSGGGIYNAKGELVGLVTNKIPCVLDPWRDDCGGLGTSLAGRVR